MFGFGGGERSNLHVGVLTDVQGKELVDALNKSFGDLGKGISSLNPVAAASVKYFNMLFSPAGIITAGVGVVGAFGAASIKAASEFQMLETRLKFATGSAKEAAAAFKAVKDVEAATPFELPELVKAATLIEQFGLRSKELIPIVADMAAAMGRDVTETAMVMNKALIGSQDGLQMLRDSFGITKDQLKEFGAEFDKSGAITNVEKLDNALLKLVEHKYAGAAAEQSKTLAGAISTLNGAVKVFLANQGAPFIDFLTKSVQGLSDVVGTVGDPRFQRGLGGTVPKLGGVGGLAQNGMGKLGEAIVGGWFNEILRDANAPITSEDVALASIRAGADPSRVLTGRLIPQQIADAVAQRVGGSKTSAAYLFKGKIPVSSGSGSIKASKSGAWVDSYGTIKGKLSGKRLDMAGYIRATATMNGMPSDIPDWLATGNVAGLSPEVSNLISMGYSRSEAEQIAVENQNAISSNRAFKPSGVSDQGISASDWEQQMQSRIELEIESIDNTQKWIDGLGTVLNLTAQINGVMGDTTIKGSQVADTITGILTGVLSLIPGAQGFAPLVGGLGKLVSSGMRNQEAAAALSSKQAGQTVVVQKAYGMSDLQGQIRDNQLLQTRNRLAWQS